MAKLKPREHLTHRKLSRADELVRFLEEIVFAKRKATEREVQDVCKELQQYVPNLEPSKLTRH